MGKDFIEEVWHACDHERRISIPIYHLLETPSMSQDGNSISPRRLDDVGKGGYKRSLMRYN